MPIAVVSPLRWISLQALENWSTANRTGDLGYENSCWELVAWVGLRTDGAGSDMVLYVPGQ